MCCGIERRRIFWEGSDRDDFLKRLETILTATQTPCKRILKPGKQPARVYAKAFYAIGPSAA
jgi:hypothetical protein